MAELIRRYENPAPGTPAAEYLACGGVRVTVMAPKENLPPQDPPAWVLASLRIIRARAEEYARETGRPPTLELMEDFQRDRGAELDKWIRDPRKNTFQPMSLREWELKRAQGV